MHWSVVAGARHSSWHDSEHDSRHKRVFRLQVWLLGQAENSRVSLTPISRQPWGSQCVITRIDVKRFESRWASNFSWKIWTMALYHQRTLREGSCEFLTSQSGEDFVLASLDSFSSSKRTFVLIKKDSHDRQRLVEFFSGCRANFVRIVLMSLRIWGT